MPPEIDDQMVRLIRKRRRTRAVAGAIIAPGVILLASGGQAMIFPTTTHHRHPEIGVVMFVAAATFLVLLVVISWLTRLPQQAGTQHALLRRADDIRYKRTRSLALLPVCAALLLMSQYAAIERQGSHLPPGQPVGLNLWLIYGGFVAFVLINALIVGGVGGGRRIRMIIDDELSLSFRNRSLRAGYLTLMLAVASTYAVALYDPAKTILMLPGVLFLGLAVPALWFVSLERAADGGE